MEEDILNYFLHTAPSLVVLGVLLLRMEKWQSSILACLQRMLEDCWTKVLDQIEPSKRDD